LKSTEAYLDDYLDKYNELKKLNELWRMRVTPQQFLTEIDRIRAYGIEARKNNYHNEYAITQYEKGKVEIMLMNNLTIEEMKAQVAWLNISQEIEFANAMPQIKARLNTIKTPLKFADVRNIYQWLFRKQITLEMLPPLVLEDFSKTRQYKFWMQKRD
jgi:hypothetical protein